MVYVRCKVLCLLVVAGSVFLVILIVMCGDRRVLLCVACFISGIVVPETC